MSLASVPGALGVRVMTPRSIVARSFDPQDTETVVTEDAFSMSPKVWWFASEPPTVIVRTGF